jgi:endonuclease YncB( thermonuclease family)/WD40 repeat protein
MESKNQIVYRPVSFKMGDYSYARITDADTPYIESAIRMLSIDAPEVHYPAKPTYEYDAELELLGKKLESHDVYPEMDDGLRNYLIPRLKDKPGTRQYVKGLVAADQFQKILHNHLYPPNRHSRKLLLIGSGERFDSHGRTLAYITPSYSKAELKKYPRSKRKTFNLLLVEKGWAASFPLFPSLPNPADLERLREGAENAQKEHYGLWEDELLLLGYEFRMCVRLASGKPIGDCIYRYCVDMTSKELFSPQQYYKISPANRIFIDKEDLEEAKRGLGLAETNKPQVIRDNPMYGANPFPGSNTLYATWSDPSDGTTLAVGECGTIYHIDRIQLENKKLNSPLQVNHKVDFYDVFGFSKKDIWAVGTFGQVWRYEGKAWQYHDTLIPSGFKQPVWLEAVWGRKPDDLFIAGDESAIYHYDGTQWKDIAKPPRGKKRSRTHFYSIGGLDEDVTYAVGSFGTILKITANSPAAAAADNLSPEPYTLKWYQSGYSETLNAIQRIPGTQKFLVCGTGGTLFWWEKDKATPVEHGLKDDFYGIDAPAKDKIIVVGRKGRALFYNGQEWVKYHLGINSLFEGVVFTGNNQYLAAGWFGRIMSFDATSERWNTLQAGMAETILSVKIHPEGQILAAAESGTLLYADNQAKDFKTFYAPALDIRAISPVENGSFLLSGPDGYAAIFQCNNGNPIISPINDNSLRMKRNQTQVFAESRYHYVFGENLRWFGIHRNQLIDLSKDKGKGQGLDLSNQMLSCEERLTSGAYCSISGTIILGGSRGTLFLLKEVNGKWEILSVELSGTYRPVMALDLSSELVIAGFSGGQIMEYALPDMKPVRTVSITAPSLNSISATKKGFVYCGENGCIGLLSKKDYSSNQKVRVIPGDLELVAGNPDILASCVLDENQIICGGAGQVVLVKDGKLKKCFQLKNIIITSLSIKGSLILAGTSSGKIISWDIPCFLKGTLKESAYPHPFKKNSSIVSLYRDGENIYAIREDDAIYELFSQRIIQNPVKELRITHSFCPAMGKTFFLGGAKKVNDGSTYKDVHYLGVKDFLHPEDALVEIPIPDNTFSETTLNGFTGTGDCWAGGFSGTLLLWAASAWYKIHLGVGNHLISLAENNGYIAITGKQGSVRFEKTDYIKKGLITSD